MNNKKKKHINNRIEKCIYCDSDNIKLHGKSTKGTVRYICKDCKKSFSESHDSIIKRSRLNDETWLKIIKGFVNNESITSISKQSGVAISCICEYRQKIHRLLCNEDRKQANNSFKGKKDAAFFIYTLNRMPIHHRSRQQKIEYLEKNGLYQQLLEKEPDKLEKLLSDKEIRLNNNANIDKTYELINSLTGTDENKVKTIYNLLYNTKNKI